MSAMRRGIPIRAAVWSPVQSDHEAASRGVVAASAGGEMCDIGAGAPFLGDRSAVGAAYPPAAGT